MMDLSRIVLGSCFPEEFPVVVEIPMDHPPIKYEIDKNAGALWVDRLMSTTMRYPCNYGFVPHTLAKDGDPVDVLVVTPYPIVPTAVIAVRPIEVLVMEDEAGWDEKIIAIPTAKVAPEWATYQQLDEALNKRIVHFFTHYKDLDPGKWVKVVGFGGKEKATALLVEAADRVKHGHGTG